MNYKKICGITLKEAKEKVFKEYGHYPRCGVEVAVPNYFIYCAIPFEGSDLCWPFKMKVLLVNMSGRLILQLHGNVCTWEEYHKAMEVK